ncbi:MAG: DUF1831 domain-containing protein [Streptococcaceae bacterium]|jgi:hypothetical protein|nr:DUF1831 domain-containing protein [Streptococcaceae bacterium]
MAFVTEKHLEDSRYTYKLSPNIKKYTLLDTTFIKNRIGNYELTRVLENVPNSGEGPMLKITVKADLTGFKLSITDQSGLKNINIFKSEATQILQEKFYFQLDALVDRDIFVKN